MPQPVHKKRSHASKTVNLAVRVPADLAQAFSEVAVREDRTVSAELRRLMKIRVAEKGPLAA